MINSLLLELEGLSASGWHHRASIPAAALSDPGQGSVEPLKDLCSDMDWEADLVRKGDCCHLTGSWQVAVKCTCARCNVRFGRNLKGENLRDYRVVKSGNSSEDDELPAPGKVNLLDVLREDIWLALELFPLCRPDCRGLCPQCGENMNEEHCSCRPDDSGHPFAALRKLK
ncbi:MAG: DUF177 domain-containing protein [Mariprofundaceae bacterium]